mmetsp:Transcript_39187/g.84362  ORF Transcript_39187/g.84362 Transcript_39187/m.84362 type:complete len:214 (-) Transcript_39187:1412-2053(-)
MRNNGSAARPSDSAAGLYASNISRPANSRTLASRDSNSQRSSTGGSTSKLVQVCADGSAVALPSTCTRKGKKRPWGSRKPCHPQGRTLEPVTKANILDRATADCFRNQSKNQPMTCGGPSVTAYCSHSSTSNSLLPQISIRSCSASRLLAESKSSGTNSWKPMMRHPISGRMGPMRKSSHKSWAYSSLFCSVTGNVAPSGFNSLLPSAEVKVS